MWSVRTIPPNNLVPTQLKVAAYCRVSTNSLEQQTSLSSQEQYYEEWISFIENAAVKTAAFSRLTTEIPQTDFCFNYLTGTPFQECPSFLFVPILFSASQLISLEVAAISQTVAFSA